MKTSRLSRPPLANTTPPATGRLYAEQLRLAYGDKIICPQLELNIPDGSLSVIVGPNGCGKSTLLRSLCRLITPSAGQVYLDGKRLPDYPSRALAQQLGLLPQSATAPAHISVYELVARGRYPHQSWLHPWSEQDETAVQTAMRATDVHELAKRAVDTLSGGQRQRVWVAMALAQETPILLLDEPTTYLDIAHQIDLLELFRELNQQGRTLIAVLHDLNHACRYATHLIAMREGRIIATGAPNEIVTAEMVEQVFGLSCLVMPDPISHTPMIIPRGKSSAQATPTWDRSQFALHPGLKTG